MDEKPEYQIYWVVKSTGVIGHGEGYFTQSEANNLVKALNEDQKNIDLGLVHWAEQAQS